MHRRFIVGSGVAVVVLGLGGFGGWLLSLPSTRSSGAPPAIDRREAEAMVEVLTPPKRQRPAIAIIGINDATEVTDYLLPYGILRRADVADVMMVSTNPGPVTLFPALTVEPDATVAAFDARYPDGADYVVVPAMSRDDDPAALEWIRSQAAKGATIIGVCAGAKVVAATGLLDGQRATTHWYYLRELRKEHPSIVYVPNRRVVAGKRVVTTTGITASMPMFVTLIEAIAGRARAETVAHDLGMTHWDARHDSEAFALTRPFALTVMGNVLAFWNREELGIEVRRGIDEVSLALVTDAWSRTYRSRAVTVAASSGVVESRHGVRIVPDRISTTWPAEHLLPPIDTRPPAVMLKDTLEAIGERYGRRTSEVVTMQLEYPTPDRPSSRTAGR